MKRTIALILCIFLLCGCTGNEIHTEQFTTIFAMDTVMTMDIWGEDAQLAATSMAARIAELEKDWSATNPDSILTRMNRGENVELSGAAEALLVRIEALSQRTGGAFDPKLRTVSELWGFYNDEHRVPAREAILDALGEQQWDLGAAMKGYAGQECTALLAELEIDRALLNLGGNVQTYGEKPDGSPWRIAIQNPDPAEDYLGIVEVTGTMAVVTSGDYQRYFEQDGVRYHHILDPETGYPADSGLRSVTVICRDGLTADALSTALFVMGLEDAVEFWRQSDDFEAIFVTADGKVYATEGAVLSGCTFEVIER